VEQESLSTSGSKGLKVAMDVEETENIILFLFLGNIVSFLKT